MATTKTSQSRCATVRRVHAVIAPSTAVVLLQRDADGNIAVRDANGNVRLLAEGTVLSELHELLNDDSLPKVQDVPTDEANMENAATKLVEHLAPEPLRPFVNFGIRKLRETIANRTATSDSARNFRMRHKATTRGARP